MAQPSGRRQALADFARSLHTTFSTASASSAPLLSPNDIHRLDVELNSNPFGTVAITSGNEQLDTIGTLLWNDCIELLVSHGNNPNDVLLLGKVRALAFAVLNMAVLPDLLGSIRALDLALKAARICLVNQQCEIALNILSVAALRLASIQPAHLGLDATINGTLTTRYNSLRARLAWFQDRVDIAEHFFAKVSVPGLTDDEEAVFETCFIIGDSALARRQFDIALIWLERARDRLEALSIMTEIKFPDYHNWNLVVRHSLAVACTQIKTSYSDLLYNLEMGVLRENYPEHPAVILFDLSMGHNNPGLQSLVEKTTLTDMNMPIIFQFARSLGHAGGSDNGMEALRILLMRPLPSREWTEKCFVSFTLLLSRSECSDPMRIRTLRGVIDALEQRGFPSISANAAHATVICIWKMTGSALLKNDYWTAQLWLQMCSEPKIFQHCSQFIQIAIQKKLLVCYLQTGNLAAARRLMDRGLVQSQVDCGRLYLSYKLSLLEGKDGSGHFYLGFPLHPVPHKQMSLLSCAIEAQRQDKPEEVLNCFDQLTKCLTSDDIYHQDFTAAEHYIFAITLLLQELQKGFSQRLGECIETVLRSALSYAKENSMFEGGDQEVSVTQLQFLYFATYNLALKLINSSGFLHATSVLNYSREFALQYRQIAYPEMDSNAPRPHLFAVAYLRLLAASLKARREIDQNKKITRYVDVRICFKQLKQLHGWEDEEEASEETNEKEDRHLDIARFFDFEASMYLRQWDEIIGSCASDERFPKPKFYAPILDLNFQWSLPPAVSIPIIKHIMSKLSELQNDPPTTFQGDFRVSLPRYLHCLFSRAIAPPPFINPNTIDFLDVKMANAEVAEEVLDRVLAIIDKETSGGEVKQEEQDSNPIQSGSTLNDEPAYPVAELLKISSVAFNKATDFYRATRDEDCQRWAKKAIRIAQLAPGSQARQLVQTLQTRLGSLV
ncbi:Meiosis specific protein SPO22 [Penicillium coprophilum]|uniref:Meiosis specific protein SPO22 n=1 Tax=Penicillium coprophilum TaxID=36646 RepID=UPI0023990EB6|nr:Meiosis specific protein SPO22 [Penicillium coprophilum]KAJ5173573.1 Meiosis specific protein SPO22 [Penicillium coprophilum]